MTQQIQQYQAPQSQFGADLEIAKALCTSELLPDAYRNSIPNTLIAIDVARRMQLSILQVTQNLHIMFGKPSWSASFLIGLVNVSGKFSRLKPQYLGEGIQRGCRMVATDLADGIQCVGTVFTYAMAEAEGYVNRKGSKWKTFGEQMLMYRAASLWIKVFAPETSLGMQTSDEADDIGAFAVSGTAAPVSARRGTRGSAAISAASDKLNQRLEASTVASPSLGDQLAKAAAERQERDRVMQDAVQRGTQRWQEQSAPAVGHAFPVDRRSDVEVRADIEAALYPSHDREPGADDEGLHSPD